jgi:hypothetical protein
LKVVVVFELSQRVGYCWRGGGAAGQLREQVALPVHLRKQQLPGHLDAGGARRRECLGTAKRRQVRPTRRRGCEQVAVRVEVDHRGTGVGQPAQRVKRDVAGLPDHHEPAELAGDTVILPRLPARADAIVDDEVASLDVNLEPVAAGDADGTASAVSRP